MLNFGPTAVPLAYLLLGFVVGRVRHFVLTVEQGDSRLVLLPFLATFCFKMLVADSDNMVFSLIKDGAVPIVVLVLSSTRVVAGPERETRSGPSLRLAKSSGDRWS